MASKGQKCPYCGSSIIIQKVIRDGPCLERNIHGDNMAICSSYPKCDSYVACHPNGKPMGALANPNLRYLRKQAHLLFDPLWEEGHMTRREAYRVLRQYLKGIQRKHCHIAHLSEQQCKDLIDALRHRKEKTLWVSPTQQQDSKFKKTPFGVKFLRMGHVFRCVSVGEGGCRSFFKFSIPQIQNHLRHLGWDYIWKDSWHMSLAA
jgi:polyhydroxyalkanoate synthesis regulator phasin